MLSFYHVCTQFGAMLAIALNVVFGQSISEVANLNNAMLTVFQSVLQGACATPFWRFPNKDLSVPKHCHVEEIELMGFH